MTPLTGSSPPLAPDAPSPTKITYIDGRPTTITLRRCKLLVSVEEAGSHSWYVVNPDSPDMKKGWDETNVVGLSEAKSGAAAALQMSLVDAPEVYADNVSAQPSGRAQFFSAASDAG